MKTFNIYTKPNCPYCVKAKELIERNKDKYIEYIIGETISRDQLISMFPYAKTVPQIVLKESYGDKKNIYIGGYDQLFRWYLNNKKSA